MVYRLVCFDMDGVIFKDTNFWMELHKKFGTLEQGRKLTEKYLDTDYDRLVAEVVARLWKGKDARLYYELVDSVPYLPGVAKTIGELKKKGYATAIVSASSSDLARRAQKDLGIDHVYTNELVIRDGKISGEFISVVGVGREKKARLISQLCKRLGIALEETIYIGDTDIDIDAVREVGMGIAFNSTSPELKKAARYVVEGQDLSEIIKYID